MEAHPIRAAGIQQCQFATRLDLPESNAVSLGGGEHLPVRAEIAFDCSSPPAILGSVADQAGMQDPASLVVGDVPDAELGAGMKSESAVVGGELKAETGGGDQRFARGSVPQPRGPVPAVGGQKIAPGAERTPNNNAGVSPQDRGELPPDDVPDVNVPVRAP